MAKQVLFQGVDSQGNQTSYRCGCDHGDGDVTIAHCARRGKAALSKIGVTVLLSGSVADCAVSGIAVVPEISSDDRSHPRKPAPAPVPMPAPAPAAEQMVVEFSGTTVVRMQLIPVREKRICKAADIFGEGVLGECTVYAMDGTPGIPAVDKHYRFNKRDLSALLLAWELGDRTLIWGHTGCGKTSFVEQAAARLGRPVVKINFNRGMSYDRLIGSRVVVNGETPFLDGLLPQAYKGAEGTVILCDEYGANSEECAFALQRPMDKTDGHLVIMEDGGRTLPLPAGHVIVACDNHSGSGDATGLYAAGTAVQNYAHYNRFGTVIRADYMDEKKEAEMIDAKTGCGYDNSKIIASMLRKSRDAFEQGKLNGPISTREGLAWAEKLGKMPVEVAFTYSIGNRIDPTDARALLEVLNGMLPS
jgi:cobaltochelatase CobS